MDVLLRLATARGTDPEHSRKQAVLSQGKQTQCLPFPSSVFGFFFSYEMVESDLKIQIGKIS